MKMPVFTEPDTDEIFVNNLSSPDQDDRLQAVTNIKNTVIGNKAKKLSFIRLNVIPRIIELLSQDDTSVDFVVESIVLLGSLARGSTDSVQALLEARSLNVFLKGICHSDPRVVEASVRSLRTLNSSPLTPSAPIFDDSLIIPKLVELLSSSFSNAECAASVLSKCCQGPEHQALLCNMGAVNALMPLLVCDLPKIQLPALLCYATMSFQNGAVSLAMKSASHQGQNLIQIFTKLLSRDRPEEIQLGAAKCLTNMHRAGAISGQENRPLLIKILATAVRMCKWDKSLTVRVEAAETLAFLIEEDTDLQRTAAISDHLIKTLTGFLVKNGLDDSSYALMRESAFKALASVGANDEDIRKKIIDIECTMDHVVSGLEDPNTNVKLAAVKCLHSLSRSVQQLRTSFQETAVWKPIMKLLQDASDNMLTVASSALCNLLLEFSPSKEPILEAGAVNLLSNLTRRQETALRLNGVWALMNMAYQADDVTKNKILEVLGPDQLFSLLDDPDTQVTMKTLGLMRNLLSGREDIDRIMLIHGSRVMESVKPILDGETRTEDVKEQALCVIANIANGSSAKEFVMRDESLLKRLMQYMMNDSVKLQMAATYCVSNLVWSTEDGAVGRQQKLRDLGVQKLLQSLLTTSDVNLFERVKTALQQFT
ncbi:armadillo repeat-containing protein 8-like isoform X2 [Acropora millepora]|uniref:armadillo repeat-containing protein 8-like isoform X2 n=1 Tax=Acropora millepora TaxID=45264 RepID=UPI001CF13E5A|nr:armadillo repeat-containing protein 8-like isoform X2 [Acropora millepora]